MFDKLRARDEWKFFGVLPQADRPLSDLKSVGPVMINGSSSNMFQIVFNDGKVYNFAPMGQGDDALKALKAAHR